MAGQTAFTNHRDLPETCTVPLLHFSQNSQKPSFTTLSVHNSFQPSHLMAGSKRSPTPEHLTTEDPDTAAARKELRQTAISDKPNLSTMSNAETNPAPNAAAGDDKPSSKGATPDRDSPSSQNDDLRDQISSPKKKRARDEVDEPQDAPSDANGDISPIGSDNGTSINRTVRSEPEKKRPRDVSSESKVKVRLYNE